VLTILLEVPRSVNIGQPEQMIHRFCQAGIGGNSFGRAQSALSNWQTAIGPTGS
jgi:hypothetical protein